MRYLAIDHGLKRTGLAICDRGENMSSPFAVLEGKTDMVLAKIVKTIRDEEIEGVVIGLPLNMDDSEGGQAKYVRKFAKELEKLTELPIHFQDERLSSFGAEQKLQAVELTRKKKKKRLDAVAAAEILEAFLAVRKDV